VSTPDLLSFVPEASWFPSIVPVEKYHKEYGHPRENAPLIIYNSATKPRKSAPLLKKLVGDLETRGVGLEIQQVRTSHKNNLNRKSRADIYFDGLRIFYGVNAIEAGAFEMPVVCGISQRCKEHLDKLGMECGFQAFNLTDYGKKRDDEEYLALVKAYRT